MRGTSSPRGTRSHHTKETPFCATMKTNPSYGIVCVQFNTDNNNMLIIHNFCKLNLAILSFTILVKVTFGSSHIRNIIFHCLYTFNQLQPLIGSKKTSSMSMHDVFMQNHAKQYWHARCLL